MPTPTVRAALEANLAAGNLPALPLEPLADLFVGMTRIPDYDQIADSYDRRYAEHEYAGTENQLHAFVAAGLRVLDVGCGTGYWLQHLRSWGCHVAGLDPSAQMLARAAARLPDVALVRGRAEALPWRRGSLDRIVCINALHHVQEKPRFIAEARRVLRSGGGFLSIGLDPSAGSDLWCIYDYFEPALELDRGRYPSAARLRGWLRDAGFAGCTTVVAERIRLDRPARECLDRDLLAKSSASQLALLSDEQYARGIDRIRRDIEAAEAEGRSLRLTADLRLYGTLAAVPGDT